MTGKRLVALDFPGTSQFEALGSTSIGFHFWHDKTPLHLKNRLLKVVSMYLLEKGKPFNSDWIIYQKTSLTGLKLYIYLWFRANEHHKLPAFHAGLLENNRIVDQGLGDLVHGVNADSLAVDDLPTTKSHG